MVEYLSNDNLHSKNFLDLFEVRFHPPRHYAGICKTGEFILPYSVRICNGDGPLHHFGILIGLEHTELVKNPSHSNRGGDDSKPFIRVVKRGYESGLIGALRTFFRTGEFPADVPIGEPLEFVNVGPDDSPGKKKLAYLEFEKPVVKKDHDFNDDNEGLVKAYELSFKVYVLGDDEPSNHSVECVCDAEYKKTSGYTERKNRGASIDTQMVKEMIRRRIEMGWLDPYSQQVESEPVASENIIEIPEEVKEPQPWVAPRPSLW